MHKEQKNLLVFGYGWAVILMVVALRLWMKYGISAFKIVLLTLALLFLLASVWRVQLLKPVYKIWMAVGHKVSFAISTVILGILFYTLFSITGLILRLLRKDLLNRSIQPEVNSYWLVKEFSGDVQESFKRQF